MKALLALVTVLTFAGLAHAADNRPLSEIPQGSSINLGKSRLIVANTAGLSLGSACSLRIDDKDMADVDRVISAGTMMQIQSASTETSCGHAYCERITTIQSEINNKNVQIKCSGSAEVTVSELASELAADGGSLMLAAPQPF